MQDFISNLEITLEKKKGDYNRQRYISELSGVGFFNGLCGLKYDLR